MGRSKDTKKPKGRMGAYAFFVQARRKTYGDSSVKKLVFADFSKECAALWKVRFSVILGLLHSLDVY